MSTYLYEAYGGVIATPPEVHISRHVSSERSPIPVLDVKLDWTRREPFEVALGDNIHMAVSPYMPSSGIHAGYVGARPGASTFRLQAWGRCNAFIRRWGATMPLDVEDPRVLAGLREREQFEAMAWMVIGDGQD